MEVFRAEYCPAFRHTRSVAGPTVPGTAHRRVFCRWRPTGATLLSDGSIAVALECADWRHFSVSITGPRVDPASLPVVAGLGRLVPRDFALDTSMGGGAMVWREVQHSTETP